MSIAFSQNVQTVFLPNYHRFQTRTLLGILVNVFTSPIFRHWFYTVHKPIHENMQRQLT